VVENGKWKMENGREEKGREERGVNVVGPIQLRSSNKDQ